MVSVGKGEKDSSADHNQTAGIFTEAPKNDIPHIFLAFPLTSKVIIDLFTDGCAGSLLRHTGFFCSCSSSTLEHRLS